MSHHLDNTQIWETKDSKEINSFLIGKFISSKAAISALVFFGVLTFLGVTALVIKFFVDGDDSTSWGYVSTVTAILLGLSIGGSLTSIMTFLVKGVWDKILARISSLFALLGIVTSVFMIPLALQIPPLIVDDIRRRSVWYEAPIYSPQVWAIVGILGFAVAGLFIFYLSALPDFAVMRDHSTGFRQKLGRVLARNWKGSSTQWSSLRVLNGGLGAIYILLGFGVIFLFTSDFNMGLVPGWRDSLYAFSFSVVSVQSGFAAFTLAAWFLRNKMGLKTYAVTDHFWPLGRLLFASTLGWIYVFYSGFIVFWYGRSLIDISVLKIFISGQTLWITITSITFSFLIPLLILIWNKGRRSAHGPAIASVFILIGLFLERLRINLPSWSIPTDKIHDKYLTDIPSLVGPNALDIIIVVGGLAAVVFVVMFGMYLMPSVSIWQTLNYNLLVRPAKYLKAKGAVIVKPD